MRSLLFALQWSLTGLGIAFIALLGWSFAGGSPGGLEHLVGRGPADAAGYATAVRRAAPAVVSVRALGHDVAVANPLTGDPVFQRFFGAPGDTPRTTTTLGSGVVLNADGVVVTNHHVIADAERIVVMLTDGRSALAELVGSDPESDLAVLRVSLGALPVMPVAAERDVSVGDIVLAIGNPFAIGQTVTQGIVSATGRNRVGINTFENFIQTDAAINVGNSGGALVDTRGALVGINTARTESDGIGFAIPARLVVEVAREIVDNGSVRRGWIGIDARDLARSPDSPAGVERGIAVHGVVQGGPADVAGLRRGDIIVAIGEHAIADSREALDRIAAIEPGTPVTIGVLREGQRYDVIVVASPRPPLG